MKKILIPNSMNLLVIRGKIFEFTIFFMKKKYFLQYFHFTILFRLKWLKRIRREKEFELREGSSSNNAMSKIKKLVYGLKCYHDQLLFYYFFFLFFIGLFVHSGYKCDGCGQDPIRDGRFTCLECLDNGDAIENIFGLCFV